jgi:hypothetical protein
MTKIDKPHVKDRITTIDDERKRVLDLYDMQLVPPEGVGIFDEPTRCYKINLQWAKIVMGMVSWLTEIAPWYLAENEDYEGINQVAKFLAGTECDVTDYRLRQKPGDNCILQQSIDAGMNWEDVFDFSLCATIQDKSYQISIQNQVTNVQETFIDIYNNYTANYTGLPSSVYPDLATPPAGTDDSALSAAYCNAVWELVRTACNAAVSYYTESINQTQGEANFLLAVAGFALTAVALAAALPSAGASLVALGAAAPLIAAGVGLGAGLANYLVDFWQQHTIDQFQDTEAMEAVACYIVDNLSAEDNTYQSMKDLLDLAGGSANFLAIAGFLDILLEHDSTYAAFLEKWNHNLQYAEAGIDLYCPCASEYKVWTWDFANGLGPFTIDTNGVYTGGRVKGTTQGDGDADVLMLTMPFDPTWRIRSVRMHTERILGISNGADDYATFKMRPTVGSNTDSFNPIQGGFRPNGLDMRCNVMINPPFYWTGANQIWIAVSVSNNLDDSEIYLDKVEIMFEADFAKGGYITDDDDLCS